MYPTHMIITVWSINSVQPEIDKKPAAVLGFVVGLWLPIIRGPQASICFLTNFELKRRINIALHSFWNSKIKLSIQNNWYVWRFWIATNLLAVTLFCGSLDGGIIFCQEKKEPKLTNDLWCLNVQKFGLELLASYTPS